MKTKYKKGDYIKFSFGDDEKIIKITSIWKKMVRGQILYNGLTKEGVKKSIQNYSILKDNCSWTLNEESIKRKLTKKEIIEYLT